MNPLEFRHGRVVAVALPIVAAAALVLWRSGSTEETPAPAPAPTSLSVDATPPSPSPAPPQSAEGLRLYGLLGRGAIIALPDGQQRFYAIGREVRPGLRVERIEPQGVILVSAGGEIRLGFDGATPNRSAASAASATAAGSTASGQEEDTLRYRLGLAPRRVGTRVTSFVVRPNVSMPALERAGLRPGDVILSVNGSEFDEERMLELAWTINAGRTEFDVERGGRRIRLSLEN